MKNGDRTKKQLIEEIDALRHRVAELEKSEAEPRQIKEHLKLELTEHRMAEAALQESKEKYQTIFENTGTAMAILEEDMTISLVNTEFERLSGYSKAEIEGKKNWTEFVVKEDLAKMKEYHSLRRIAPDSVPKRYEFRPFDRQGNISNAVIAVEMIPGTKRSVVSFMDITARMKAEEALRESEEKYSNLVERANDGIVIIQDGIMKYVNPRLPEMGGYTVEEVTGTPFTDYVHPDELPKLIDRYVRRMAGEDVEPIYETILRRRDGGDVNVEINASTVLYQERTAELVLVRDITERKQAEEELKASRERLRKLSTHLQSVREEERTSLARDIHDELGQALTALKIDLSWLSKRFPADQKSLLEKTSSMSKLVDMTIQKVKRISTELRPGLLDDFGLVAAIEWQAGEFQKLTGIRTEISPKLKDIVLDRDRSTVLFRIFQELLTNIARHADATKVKLSLIEEADKIVLTVKDNGRGITREQLSNPRSFGLLGMRERVHFWQGELKISGAPGKGTTAVASIPLANKENDDAKNTYC
ncbi:MAG: PAS domain S-box protein [Desulfobacteria bacterium]